MVNQYGEERYRALFSSIDEGFSVIEVLFDRDGRPIDYQFLEVNPSFERQTGLVAATGRWMRELAPGHEQHWFDIYGRVALTGEPVRFQNEAGALGGRWFDVNAFRIGPPERRQVGILFRDITERVRAEAERDRLATQRQLALDAARLGWWHYDPQTKVATFDERYKEIFGVTGNQRPNEEILRRLHPDDLPGVWAKVEAALDPADPKPYTAEYRIARDDGSVRWVEAHGTATFEGEGENRRATSFVGTVADITDRKLAVEQSRGILESVSDAFFALDREWRFTYLNPQAQRVLGRSSGDLIGRVIWDEYRLGGTEFERAYRRAATGQVAVSFTSFYPDHDRWYEVNAYPAPDGVSVYFRDATGRVRAEEQLRRSHDTFYHLIQNNPFGVYVVDADFKLRQVSLGSQKVFATVPEPLLGRDFAEVLRAVWAEPFASEAIRLFRHTLDTGEPYASPRTVERRQDFGVVEAYDWRIERITLPDGRFGVVCYFYDLSERQRWEAALAETRRRLDSALIAGEVGTFEWDVANDRLWGDRNFKRIFGIELDASGAAPLATYVAAIHPADRDRVLGLVRRSVDTGCDYAAEYRITSTTPPRWVTAQGKVERDDAGRVARFPGVVVDVTERKQAEERLRTSEERYRRLVETAHEGVWTIDAAGRTTYVNRRMSELLGYAPEEMIGRVHTDFMWEQDRPKGDVDMELRRQGTAQVWDQRYRRKDGSELWTVASCSALRDTDGVFAGALGMFTDITDRKRAEGAVREREERLRLATETADLGIWVWQIATDYVVWENDRMYEIVGLPRTAEPVNAARFRSEYVHPDDATEFDRVIGNAVRSGDRFFFQGRFRRGDGELRRVEFSGTPRSDAGGTPISILGTAADITERKNAELVLRESEERFRLLAEALPQMVWTAHADGTVEYFNRKWYAYTENTEGTTGDAAWYPAFDPQTAVRVREAWYKAVRSGEPYELEYTLRRASDGMDRWHLARALPLRDATGRVVRWFGAITDIHDLKEAQARIEQLLGSERVARDEAERAGRMKDEFLATLSHELRTPLNAILGWAQILAGGSRDAEDLQEGLRTIERNARAQTQIIEDLLDMSRIISGKVRLDAQRVDLAAIVREAVATAKPSADAKAIRLHAVLDPHAGPVSGDPARLQQVMWNLLTNAVKFTPNVGRIQVLLERVNSHLELRVSDTGEGIAPEFLPHVFDRFRQADATTTRRHGGLGLGLSIVKQLVELHGGSIRVVSAGVGHGTTFTVSLPLIVIQPDPDPHVERYHPRSASASASVPQDACVQIEGIKVLVVDDEPDARALVRRLLEDCHAEVVTAGSAAEALDLVRAERPDVMVCDIGMPGEDGYSLIRRVRALGREHGGQVPSAALTAYAHAEDRVKAVLAGFQMHLAKPVEPAELIATVAGLAGRTGIDHGVSR